MVRRDSAKVLFVGSIPTLASILKKMISLLNTYRFTTNHNDEILIKAYFKEEAVNIFQEKHQKIGTRYYKPTVFVNVKKLSIAEILTHIVSH